MRIRGFFAERLASFARVSTGSSNRVERLLLLAEPPSIDRGEATERGRSISARFSGSAPIVWTKLYLEFPERL